MSMVLSTLQSLLPATFTGASLSKPTFPVSEHTEENGQEHARKSPQFEGRRFSRRSNRHVELAMRVADSNNRTSLLLRLPNELLLAIQSACSQSSALFFRGTCRRIRYQLGPIPQITSQVEQMEFQHIQFFMKACSDERGLWNRCTARSKICSYCRLHYHRTWFTREELHKASQERRCLGATAMVGICRHNASTRKQLQIPPGLSLPVALSCLDHKADSPDLSNCDICFHGYIPCWESGTVYPFFSRSIFIGCATLPGIPKRFHQSSPDLRTIKETLCLHLRRSFNWFAFRQSRF
ncbi:hypothetical protein EJ08DRAFT_663325 [Tothia fuscella]|uniref:F-box domain-containing protein n=1 Tax=Tothia fuscella TaxID=1048955 RepID=A0A9P4TWB2_9PEZI|nr:hypothetical protein EJ08DRAFT_663325 [Tothia fuscella]